MHIFYTSKGIYNAGRVSKINNKAVWVNFVYLKLCRKVYTLLPALNPIKSFEYFRIINNLLSFKIYQSSTKLIFNRNIFSLRVRNWNSSFFLYFYRVVQYNFHFTHKYLFSNISYLIIETYLYVINAKTRPTRDILLPKTIKRDRMLCSVNTGSIAERLKFANPWSLDVNNVSIIANILLTCIKFQRQFSTVAPFLLQREE